MDAGVVLMSHHGSWEDARYAEAHGFASAGFVDSPLIAGDPFVAMALAAERTTTLRVGTMLAVPTNRNAPALVTAIATVNRLAKGRTFLGIGTGFTGRAVFGLGPVGPSRFAEYVAACRTLLDGNEVPFREGEKTRHIRLRHASDRYVDRDGIPIYVAADGPRALAVAGESGDGWITSLQFSSWMANAADVFESSFAKIKAAAAEAENRVIGLYTMASVGFCVLDDGESPTSARALEWVGPYAMMPFHAYADNPRNAERLPPPIRDRLDVYERNVLARLDVGRDRLYQEVHRGHLSHLLPGEPDVLTDEIVRMTTLTGTATEIAEVLRRLAAQGLCNVTLNPPPHLVRQAIADYAEKIAPLLARQ